MVLYKGSMSIEDIDYLHQNSEKSSFVVYIDSSMRNRVAYPTPSQYVIEFEEPFRLVYGVEILDATIPSTMYDVDFHNSILSFITATLPKTIFESTVPNKHVGYIQRRIAELSTHPEFLRQIDPKRAVVIGPPYNDAKIIAVSDAYYQAHKGSDIPVFVRIVKPIVRAFTLLPSQLGSTHMLLPSPYGEYGILMSSMEPADLDMIRNGQFYLDATAMQVIFFHYLSLVTDVDAKPEEDPDEIYLQLTLQDRRLTYGGYSMDTMMTEMTAKLLTNTTNMNLSVGPFPGDGDLAKRNIFTYTTTQVIIMDMERSTCSRMLGFDVYAARDQEQSFYAKITIPGNEKLFMSISESVARAAQNVTTSSFAASFKYSLVTPGIITIDGPKYIVLRCPELEGHINTSYFANKTNYGLGIFKLVSSNSIGFLRFDFVNIVRRPFHPIGKLGRLTIQFEMLDGKLYDFKGVNHNIIMSINYYVPANVTRSRMLSTLNPNYEPDYRKYLLKRMQLAGQLDPSKPSTSSYAERSDPRYDMLRGTLGANANASADVDADAKAFLQMHNAYDYSSSEEEEDEKINGRLTDSEGSEESEEDITLPM